jgi:hypothetical protein
MGPVFLFNIPLIVLLRFNERLELVRALTPLALIMALLPQCPTQLLGRACSRFLHLHGQVSPHFPTQLLRWRCVLAREYFLPRLTAMVKLDLLPGLVPCAS